jgi:hypothetical protein
MALRKPPPSVPGAGVSLNNKLASIPAKPFENNTKRIQSKTAKPTAMADIENAKPNVLTMRRFV